MEKVSVVISAFNEENKLEDCLRSVEWADEIIVVNNSSTDNTEKIARKYTGQVFTKENNVMLNVNKNFGFTKAKNAWILSLDADERVSPELKDEIIQILEGNSSPNGFYIPRKNIIFGKWIEHTGWYPDLQLRLFRKGKGKFEEKHVHELLHVEGDTQTMKEHIIHYNFDSIQQFLSKTFSLYAPNEANAFMNKNYTFSYIDAIRFPFNEFLSRYFAREGYKDGFHGFVLSILMAFYHFVVFTLLWEKHGYKELEQKEVLQAFQREAKHMKSDFLYWMTHTQLKEIKNPIKSFALKVKGKIERL